MENRKQTYFIAIEGSYQELEVSLYNNDRRLEKVGDSSLRASSSLVQIFDDLLKKHSLTLHDLSFIAVDQGPGAFTSVRVIAATVNAIAFCSSVKLFGVDGIQALLYEVAEQNSVDNEFVGVLLNAYGNDVYTGEYYKGVYSPSRVLSIADYCNELASKAITSRIILVGNGAGMHSQAIRDVLPHVEIIEDAFLTCSSSSVASQAWKRWQAGEQGEKKLIPLYLKSQKFAGRQK